MRLSCFLGTRLVGIAWALFGAIGIIFRASLESRSWGIGFSDTAPLFLLIGIVWTINDTGRINGWRGVLSATAFWLVIAMSYIWLAAAIFEVKDSHIFSVIGRSPSSLSLLCFLGLGMVYLTHIIAVFDRAHASIVMKFIVSVIGLLVMLTHVTGHPVLLEGLEGKQSETSFLTGLMFLLAALSGYYDTRFLDSPNRKRKEENKCVSILQSSIASSHGLKS